MQNVKLICAIAVTVLFSLFTTVSLACGDGPGQKCHCAHKCHHSGNKDCNCGKKNHAHNHAHKVAPEHTQ